MGRKFAEVSMQSEEILTTLKVMEESFVISPLLLLVPVGVIVLVAKKVPAIPALIIGIVSGFLLQIFVQRWFRPQVLYKHYRQALKSQQVITWWMIYLTVVV